jgi:predicted transcriptional regulator
MATITEGYSGTDISIAILELKRLNLSTRIIARLFDISVATVERYLPEVTLRKYDFSIIWKRFCVLKSKMQRETCSSAEHLVLEILSEHLCVDMLIPFVEQTLVTMRQLQSLTVSKEESGYALLLQSVFKRGILTLQSAGDLRSEAERCIFVYWPEKPRSLHHVKREVCQAVAENFRHQILPPWPKNAVRVIDGILLKELDLKFDSREYFIIAQHFGLSGFKRQTYRKIAKELHVSAARVDQIKAEAFERLRKSSSRKLLESFVMTLGEERGTEKQSV